MFVYQGSEVLGWQQQSGSAQTMAWEHRDVSNASVRLPGAVDSSGGAELEPMGMDAGAFHLIAPPPPNYRPPLKEARDYPGFADSSSSQCRVDYVDIPCSIMQDLMHDAALAVRYLVSDYQGTGAKPQLKPRGTGGTPPATGLEFVQEEIRSEGVGLFITDAPVWRADNEGGGLHWEQQLFALQQNPGLKGDRLKKYNEQRDVARNSLQNEKCRKFLSAHGFDPDKLLDAVNMQRAHDGRISMISQKSAGFYPNKGTDSPRIDALKNLPVASYFKNERGRVTGAITAMYAGGKSSMDPSTVEERSDVYFGNPNPTSGTILHEALHSLTGYGDSLLQFLLGIPIQDSSSNITKILKNNGCGR
jgi:hypothetical protein